MPKTNYAFEKRQRELETKRKKAEKAARKARPSPEAVSSPAASLRVEPTPAPDGGDAVA